MGAHNNPNGNCQPLDADRKGEVRMFTMHHGTLIRTLQRVCAECCNKQRNLIIYLRYQRCIGVMLPGSVIHVIFTHWVPNPRSLSGNVAANES